MRRLRPTGKAIEMTISREQVEAATKVLADHYGHGLGWRELAKEALEAAEKAAPLRAGGFDVTDGLLRFACRVYSEHNTERVSNSVSLRAALEAVSTELAKQAQTTTAGTQDTGRLRALEAENADLRRRLELACSVRLNMAATVEQAERERHMCVPVLPVDPEHEALVDGLVNERMASRQKRPIAASEPDRVPGPFVLDDFEKFALDDGLTDVGAKYTLALAVLRALRTLGPQPSEPATNWTADEPEPARDALTTQERAFVEAWRADESSGNMFDPNFVAIIDRLAPRPAAPISPIEALLAEMRAEHGCGDPECLSGECFWASKLEAALAQKENANG